jgi:hypothetical protein
MFVELGDQLNFFLKLKSESFKINKTVKVFNLTFL